MHKHMIPQLDSNDLITPLRRSTDVDVVFPALGSNTLPQCRRAAIINRKSKKKYVVHFNVNAMHEYPHCTVSLVDIHIPYLRMIIQIP